MALSDPGMKSPSPMSEEPADRREKVTTASADSLVLRLARAVRRDAWSAAPGSDEWRAGAGWRRHCLGTAAPRIIRALEEPSTAMLENAAKVVASMIETDTPREDALRIWRAFFDSEVIWEEEQARRRENDLRQER
jgi:hypothetical protein